MSLRGCGWPAGGPVGVVRTGQEATVTTSPSVTSAPPIPQRGYEGASRVLTTLDSVLDTLINRTGLVR